MIRFLPRIFQPNIADECRRTAIVSCNHECHFMENRPIGDTSERIPKSRGYLLCGKHAKRTCAKSCYAADFEEIPKDRRTLRCEHNKYEVLARDVAHLVMESESKRGAKAI